MTFKEFKASQSADVKIMQRISHPIYGAGNMLKPANAHPFIWCLFDNPHSKRMQVLAVSANVCGAA